MTTLAAPKSVPLAMLGDDFAAKAGVRGEQSERDQAVRLAAAHRLGEIERAVLGLAGQPVEAAPDQTFEAVREMVAPKELAAIDLAGGKILDLRDLLDEAVARDDSASGCRAV